MRWEKPTQVGGGMYLPALHVSCNRKSTSPAETTLHLWRNHVPQASSLCKVNQCASSKSSVVWILLVCWVSLHSLWKLWPFSPSPAGHMPHCLLLLLVLPTPRSRCLEGCNRRRKGGKLHCSDGVYTANWLDTILYQCNCIHNFFLLSNNFTMAIWKPSCLS